MKNRKETLLEMRERERQYHAAREEWDRAVAEGRKPSSHCLEEMWRTWAGPDKTPTNHEGTS